MFELRTKAKKVAYLEGEELVAKVTYYFSLYGCRFVFEKSLHLQIKSLQLLGGDIDADVAHIEGFKGTHKMYLIFMHRYEYVLIEKFTFLHSC